MRPSKNKKNGFYFVFCGSYLRAPVTDSHASMAEHVAHFTTKMTISVTAELEERGQTVKRVSFMFRPECWPLRLYFVRAHVAKFKVVFDF